MSRRPLTRRGALQLGGSGLGVCLAGCVLNEPPGGSASRSTATDTSPETASPAQTPPSRPSESPTATPTPELLREVTVGAVASAPAGYDVSFQVEMVDAVVTSATPAVVRVTLTNEADVPRKFGAGHRPVFSTIWSDEDKPGLLLLSPESKHELPREHTRVSRACWRPTETVNVALVMVPSEVPAGESAPIDLEVWGHSANEGECLPPGTYHFTEDYEIRAVGTPTEEIPQFVWDGFALTIGDP